MAKRKVTDNTVRGIKTADGTIAQTLHAFFPNMQVHGELLPGIVQKRPQDQSAQDSCFASLTKRWWKTWSVENVECGKRRVWKTWSVENVECRSIAQEVENEECGKRGVPVW